MPLDFPTSPTNGQYYNGFVYNAANETWDSAYAPRPATVPVTSPNVIINGAFDFWQRGTSFTASGVYTADRWTHDFVTGAGTVSRQTFDPGTAPVTDIEGTFFLRRNVTTGAQFSSLIQRIEDVRTFAGQTVTLSFWAKGTNPTGNFSVNLLQNFGSGGSAQVNVTDQPLVLTSSWTRYTFTWTLPSIAGKTIGTGSFLWLSIYQTAANTSASTLDIWGVQLEAGSAATAFRRNAPSIQAELAACRRYFQVYGNSPVGNFTIQAGTGPSFSTTQSVHVMQFDTPLRTTPSITTSGSTNFSVDLVGVTSASSTAMLFDHMNENMTRIVVTHNSNGSMGLHKAVVLIANNTANARIYVNAEL